MLLSLFFLVFYVKLQIHIFPICACDEIKNLSFFNLCKYFGNIIYDHKINIRYIKNSFFNEKINFVLERPTFLWLWKFWYNHFWKVWKIYGLVKNIYLKNNNFGENKDIDLKAYPFSFSSKNIFLRLIF